MSETQTQTEALVVEKTETKPVDVQSALEELIAPQPKQVQRERGDEVAVRILWIFRPAPGDPGQRGPVRPGDGRAEKRDEGQRG